MTIKIISQQFFVHNQTTLTFFNIKNCNVKNYYIANIVKEWLNDKWKNDCLKQLLTMPTILQLGSCKEYYELNK